MKISIALASTCLSLIFLMGCSKSSSSGSSSPTQDKLVAGKWQITAETATVNYMGKDTTIDKYATEDTCEKDDFILFVSDGTGSIDENTNKCSWDQQVEHFTWALLNSDTRLALVDSNPDTADIMEISSTQMKLRIISENTSGNPITDIITLKNIK